MMRGRVRAKARFIVRVGVRERRYALMDRDKGKILACFEYILSDMMIPWII